MVMCRAIEASPTRKADVEEFFTFQRKYDAYLRKRAYARIEFYMPSVSLEDKQEKFLAGRVAYGGDFIPANIHEDIEIKSEAVDIANYSDNAEFQVYLEDPVSFEEYVSQYMQ